MAFLHPVTLSGRHATLAPLSMAHLDGLVEAARDGELWKLWYTFIPKPELMAAEIERRLSLLAKDSMLPFTVCDAAGRIAGMTTYMNVDGTNRRVEIGSTWYAQRVQRSPLNTECKLMLLAHAFDTLDCIAVEFRTHRLNTPEPPRHRTPGCATRRHAAFAPDQPQRQPARHGRLQHHRRRMADRARPSAIPARPPADRPWPCAGGPSSWPTRRT